MLKDEQIHKLKEQLKNAQEFIKLHQQEFNAFMEAKNIQFNLEFDNARKRWGLPDYSCQNYRQFVVDCYMANLEIQEDGNHPVCRVDDQEEVLKITTVPCEVEYTRGLEFNYAVYPKG